MGKGGERHEATLGGIRYYIDREAAGKRGGRGGGVDPGGGPFLAVRNGGESHEETLEVLSRERASQRGGVGVGGAGGPF